jgi:hypothetical protein
LKKIIFIILLLSFYLNAANPVSVPVRHRVYPFLERLEALGVISRFIDGAKPMSRGKIAAFLKKVIAKREQLTSIDKNKLDYYLLEFRYEIDYNKKYKPMHKDQNLYSPLQSWTDFKKDFFRFFERNQPEEPNYAFLWENKENSFHLNVSQTLTYDQHSDDMYRSANWQEYKFRGTLGENFGYAAMVQLQAVRGDKEYRLEDPLLKGAWSEESDTKDKIYGDRAGGEIAWMSEYVGVSFAQQELEWGYGKSGNLILSNYTEHYPYLTIKADWGWGRFTAVHGKLLSSQLGRSENGYPVFAEKWLAAHRLEIAPFRWWRFSINENFIYGNRYADWAYLIPMNFYRAVQHKLRDRDNATISLDTKFLPYKGAALYAAVFLDEFKASALGSDWYGNKHAMLLGFQQLDPFGLPNISLTVEYTAIRPWVYTHKYRINNYTSDNHSLGHWAGPNSEVIYADVKKEWSRRLITGLSFRQYKHGANYDNLNIGGDILLGHNDLLGDQTEPVETSVFLDGILTTSKTYDFYARYEVFNGLFIEGMYRLTSEKSEDLEKDYSEVHFGFKFRY